MDTLHQFTEVEAAALPVAVRVGVFIAYILVIGHVVHVFGLPSRSTPARLWGVCRTVATRLLRCRCCTGRKRRTAGRLLDALVRNRMDNYTVQQALNVIKIVTHLGTFMFLVRLINYELGEDDIRKFALLLIMFFAAYVSLLLIAWECIRLTVFRLNIIYAVQMCILIVYVIQNSDDPEFFFNLGLRMTMRLLTGVLYLDYRKAGCYNIAFSIVTCWRYKHNESALSMTNGYIWRKFVASELIACVLLVATLYLIEKCLEAHLRLQIVLEHQSKASLKLLGFQCDAVLWLTPDLHIDGPAPQLSELLLLEAGPPHLEGREFERYVATDEDRERFRNFIETSTVAQGTEVIPAVLHVGMRDATNTTILVDVFHVHCMDLQGRERHLLGILENAAREARQQRYDHPRRDEPGQQYAQVPRERAQPTGSSLPSVDEDSVTSEVAASRPVGAAFDFEALDPRPPDSDLEELLLGGVSDINIKVDVFSHGLIMSECRMVFRTAGAPGFISLLPSSRSSDVRRWAQANTNCAMHDSWPDHVDRDAGPLALHHSSGRLISTDSTTMMFPRDFATRRSKHAILQLRGITLGPRRDEPNQEAEVAEMPNTATDSQSAQQAQPAVQNVQISDDAQSEPGAIQIWQTGEPQQEQIGAHLPHAQLERPAEPIPQIYGAAHQEPADAQFPQSAGEAQHQPTAMENVSCPSAVHQKPAAPQESHMSL